MVLIFYTSALRKKPLVLYPNALFKEPLVLDGGIHCHSDDDDEALVIQHRWVADRGRSAGRRVVHRVIE